MRARNFIAAMALAIMFVMLIAGCAAPAAQVTSTPPTAAAQSTAATQPTAATQATTAPQPTTAQATEWKGELNMLCTPQQEWCDGMKKEFETKNPGVTVNFVRLSSGEALT